MAVFAPLVFGAIGSSLLAGTAYAALGYAIGATIGSMLFAPKQQDQHFYGARLQDLRATQVEYGSPIHIRLGQTRGAGTVVWQSDFREVATTTTQESGGKGGGGASSSYTTYTYFVDLMLLLNDIPTDALARVLLNSELVYNVRAEASDITIAATVINNSSWGELRFYSGAPDQLPDPDYEAAKGVGNAPAHRGVTTVFIKNLALGGSDQLPSLEFELWENAGVVQRPILQWADASIHFVLDMSGSMSGTRMTNLKAAMHLVVDELVTATNLGSTFRVSLNWFSSVDYYSDFGYLSKGSNFQPMRDSIDFGTATGGTDALEAYSKANLFFSDTPNRRNILVTVSDGAMQNVATVLASSVLKISDMLETTNAPYGTATGNAVYMRGVGIGTIGSLASFDNSGVAIPVITGGDVEELKDAILDAFTVYVPTYTAITSTVAQTVAQLCDISGLSASDIDVTALSAITTPVEGLTITGATSMRQPIEALMGSYYFTACQSGDKIKFTPRGGSSLATFDYEDLGASFGDSTESALSFNMASDTELPSRMSVTYQVLEGDYQKDTQMSDRIVTAETNTVSDVMLPIIMSAEQAKGVAITNALDAQVSLMSAKIKVLFNHPELEPGDVVTVTDRDGSQYRMRITQLMDSFPIRELDLVLDDAGILTYSGITNADFFSQSVVLPLVDSDGLYLDIPILSDINNDAGFYVASGPVAEGKWYGAVTLQSDNDLDYVSGVVVPERGYFGSCTTTLGDWTGYHVFDEQNSITISIQTDAVLTNSTRAGILASPLTNAFLIGNEIIQAVNCTEISSGVWTLTRLLRGLRGTEWAMVDHVAGERAVWLRADGMRRLPMTNSRLGLTRYYKTFSNNRSAADYDGEAFTNMAIGLKPFSPTTARGERDVSNNLTITWQRRTRLSCRYGGAMGVSIPLGENIEQYEIDIYDDNTYTTVLRAITATSESAEYTAAQQTTDFGSAQAQVYVKIYQISQTVGRGYALTGVV